jgi:hypothetical protein
VLREDVIEQLVLCEGVVPLGFLRLDGTFRERLGEVDPGDFFDRLEDDTCDEGTCW